MKPPATAYLRFLSLPALSLLLTLPAHGQLGQGVAIGTVTDPTGSAVPGVTVVLKNSDTGVQRTTTTNPSGAYRFDFAEVGTYTLKASAAGFADLEVAGLVVTVGQTVTMDIHLQLAKAAQSITVEAGGVQQVDTTNAELSGLVSRSTIANLPLEIRDATAFVDLQPGAVPDMFNGSTRGAAVNGQRGGTGNFMVDGTDNNDYGQGGRSHNSSGTIPEELCLYLPTLCRNFEWLPITFLPSTGGRAAL